MMLNAPASGPRFTDGKLRFQNPQNGYVEVLGTPWVWALLFGVFYFAAKGVWAHAVIGIVAGFITYGVSWIIYPFFAESIMRTYYLRRGWQELK